MTDREAGNVRLGDLRHDLLHPADHLDQRLGPRRVGAVPRRRRLGREQLEAGRLPGRQLRRGGILADPVGTEILPGRAVYLGDDSIVGRHQRRLLQTLLSLLELAFSLGQIGLRLLNGGRVAGRALQSLLILGQVDGGLGGVDVGLGGVDRLLSLRLGHRNGSLGRDQRRLVFFQLQL